MTGRVVVHGERRAREMDEVAETLRAIGIDPTSWRRRRRAGRTGRPD
jgi:hypothetical protein